MKHLFRIAALLALFAFPVSEASATGCGTGAGTCFIVPAGGNSNATGTWTDTSGSAVSCACLPIAGDAVIHDSLGGQLTINAAFTVGSYDASGTGGNGLPFAGILTHNAVTWTITGNLFRLVSGMTYSPNSTRLILFTSTGGTTLITSAANKTLGTLTFSGAGGEFQFQTAVTAAGTVTLTAGELDLNGYILTNTGVFVATGSSTRVLNCGSGGGITFNGLGGAGADLSGTLITTDGNCNIVYGAVNVTSARSVNFGTSLTLASFTASQNQTTTFPALSMAGTTPTITTMTLNGPLWVTPAASSTMTVTTFNIVGTSAGMVFIGALSSTGTNTFNVTNHSMTWVTFQNVTFGTSAITPTNCFKFGSNFNGGACNPPSGSGGGGGIIGG